MKILGPKLENQICKIDCSDGGHGTGFFCNIPYKWNTNLKMLITNNHVLNNKDISIGQKVRFSINNEMIHYEIEIDETRIKYTNEEYDITMIEIKEKDKLDKKSFFDIDNQIFEENPNKAFQNMQIFLLHYPKGNKMEYSIGLIKNIKDNNYTIQHLCDSSGGSSGGPIINFIKFQVLGIHIGGAKGGFNFNLGTLLKEPIEKFNKEIGNNNFIMENNDFEKEDTKEIKNNKSEIKITNKTKNDELKNEDNNDEIIIQYQIDNIINYKNIRIFGDKFVKNNKNKCKILIKGKEANLSSHLNIEKNQLNDDNILELKLKGINQITNMSHLFKGWDNDYTPLSPLTDL